MKKIKPSEGEGQDTHSVDKSASAVVPASDLYPLRDMFLEGYEILPIKVRENLLIWWEDEFLTKEANLEWLELIYAHKSFMEGI